MYLHADQPITTEPNPICVKSSQQSILHSFLSRIIRKSDPIIPSLVLMGKTDQDSVKAMDAFDRLSVSVSPFDFHDHPTGE